MSSSMFTGLPSSNTRTRIGPLHTSPTRNNGLCQWLVCCACRVCFLVYLDVLVDFTLTERHTLARCALVSDISGTPHPGNNNSPRGVLGPHSNDRLPVVLILHQEMWAVGIAEVAEWLLQGPSTVELSSLLTLPLA